MLVETSSWCFLFLFLKSQKWIVFYTCHKSPSSYLWTVFISSFYHRKKHYYCITRQLKYIVFLDIPGNIYTPAAGIRVLVSVVKWTDNAMLTITSAIITRNVVKVITLRPFWMISLCDSWYMSTVYAWIWLFMMYLIDKSI